MIVTVANHKGGVGKTSLTAHLAFRAAERGNKVLAVDFDAQGNLTGTLADRGKALKADGAERLFSAEAVPVPMPGVEPNIAVLPATAALNATDRGQLSQAFSAIGHLKTLNKEFSVIVIDTAPAIGLRLTAALAASQRGDREGARRALTAMRDRPGWSGWLSARSARSCAGSRDRATQSDP